MGLMDKVKSQATQLAEKAQQAGQAGQAKLAEVQAKRKGDALLLELGGHHLHPAPGPGRRRRPKPGRPSSWGWCRQFEAEHGPVAVTSANAAVAEATGVVDPGATIPLGDAAHSSAPAAAAPPTSSAGPLPQAQYGSGEG